MIHANYIKKIAKQVTSLIRNVNINSNIVVTKPTKMGPQTPSIVKSPCNGTISPSNRQSPSPRIINDPMLKQNNNYQNIYYTKREYPNKNGLNLNIK